MTVTEAATYLTSKGYRCSPHTIRTLCRVGKILHYRVGLGSSGRIEVPEAEADRFLVRALRGEAGPADKPRRSSRRKVPAVAPALPAANAPGDGDWIERWERQRKH